jgi:predicted nucleic acid-binding protein
MVFLADSNVISEPTKPTPDPKVDDWLERNESRIVVDSIILGEVRFGVLRLPHGRKRQDLERWFGDVVVNIACISWDSKIAVRWAALLVDLHRAGYSMPFKDSMIAATALTHNLTVATRNVRDFSRAGLRVLNPFE